MTALFTDDLDARLQSDQNILNDTKLFPKVDHRLMYSAGVHKALPRVPEFFKPLIATCAQFEKQSDVAANFGVSQPTVSALANGFDNVNQQRNGNKNPELMALTQKKIDDVRDTALDRLKESLDLVGEKMPDAKIGEITQVINATSAVIERTTPKTMNTGVVANIVICAPKQSTLDSYGAPIEVLGGRID
jgi:hypothetical protein